MTLISNRKKDLGGGTILDVGVYTILFCHWVFQKEPKSIKATGILNDEGIDLEMKAELNYGDNKVAKMKTSAIYTPSNTAKIIGTKGTMTVNTICCTMTSVVQKSKWISMIFFARCPFLTARHLSLTWMEVKRLFHHFQRLSMSLILQTLVV